MGERWRGYTDDPIAEEGHDLLDRARFARRVAAVLDDVRAGSESAVMSLVGPWGSGKTSLLRLVGRAMPEPWRVVGFNPWATADAASLLGEFFETIGSALPSRQGVRGAGDALRRYAQKVSPLLGALPVAGPALAETADRALGDNTIEARAGEVADRLREVGAPILVVIDDVDRLHPDELTEVFRAVRLLGRLPMLYYLLSYDERTVLDLLGQAAVTGGDEARARAYLEKIVQYPLDLPPILPVHLERMFTDGLDRLLGDLGVPLTSAQQGRIRAAWDALMSRALSQPRAVHRFLARLATYLPLVDQREIDVADFVLLTFLQQHVPETYAFVATDRERFTCRLRPGTAEEGLEQLTLPVTDLGALEEEQAPDGRREVLREIFALPEPRDAAVRQAYRERRAVVWDYFPRYFDLGVTEGDLPDEVLRQGLRALCAGGGAEAGAAAEAVDRAIGGPLQDRLHLLGEDLAGDDAYTLLRHLRQRPVPAAQAGSWNSLPVRRWLRNLLVQCRGGPSAATVVGELLGGEPNAAELRRLAWFLDQRREGADAAWLDELRAHLARTVLGPDGAVALRRMVDTDPRPPGFENVLIGLSRALDRAQALDLLRRVTRWPSYPGWLAAELLGRIDDAPADEAVRLVMGDRFVRGVELLHELIPETPGHLGWRASLWGALGRRLVGELGRVPFETLRRLPVADVLSHALFDGDVRGLRGEEVVQAIDEGRFTLLDLAAHFVDEPDPDAVELGVVVGADRLAAKLFGDPGPGRDRLWQVVSNEAAACGFTGPVPPGDRETLAGRRALAFRAIMSIDALRERWEAEGFGPPPAVI
ncbi:P-loop NTPase fold protein [Streptomyces sp. B6B3]|uniref:P-loop NTPase fold protein n=1 Tax=Streptomyces sp. B6B3 TaxID=3153570 RepID=UPI00325DBE49